MQEYVDQIKDKSNFVVDIGASFGISPVSSYFDKYSGLCVECNPDKFVHLCRNVTNQNIHKHRGFARPDNIEALFQKYNVPKNIDILKIDIDGYDLELIKTIIEKGYRPAIIIAEINEKIPPPISFQVKYAEDYFWEGNHFYGFSIQAGKDTLEPLGYKIKMIYDNNNIMILDSKVFDVPNVDVSEMYRSGYSENDAALQALPWNRDVHHWTKMVDEPEKLRDTINEYFLKLAKSEDFIIEISA